MKISEYRKFAVATVAALASLGVVIAGGITATEWIQVALAFFGALGVYAIPNETTPQA